jgi:hypothetical protein
MAPADSTIPCRAVHRLKHIGRAAGLARDILAADEMAVFDHVPLPENALLRGINLIFLHSNRRIRSSSVQKLA